ncbi:MAG: fumarate hydratase [Ignavibacteria bacterium GWA2_55_11]|nr:MAG: fumarate hydratase [Ignavibacteria bacterium GWA2_55_11]OGU43827.1 MAG: fumarate hydratase [Ignavibacteria bacterium GWC2_56_12]OGU71917.1 MAG: fumarate hydratase [Ignavibacteria bacterium RIFCSPLOWO2_02_FULL_55_14]OGU73110.1 MAG: fumarate hydratase [Ignavibacteria bacterium RIFCSPLOWO2_12_FULL_56_21]HAV23122.1 fumarate hydratase [Bacteroidota bacterium]
MKLFKESILQLITETSTNLPPDVRRALVRATEVEDPASQSGMALQMIAVNVDMACDHSGPICQDTGMLTFEVHTPVGANQIVMRAQIREAVAQATKLGKLRPNSVDSITGKNSGDNLGPGTPVIHFEQHEKDEIDVRLILKGGGCENKNIQYSVPIELPHLGRADRTLEGVRKCIMHAVWQAQGHGCSVGALGVAIGGDRASGYASAKQQLFRSLDDVNPNPELAALEERIVRDANSLGIGTMGFGGRVSLIGCKIGAYNRLPASFFVSVAYDCWAFRRLGVVLDATTGKVHRWLYKDDGSVVRMAKAKGLPATGREVRLTTPISESQVRSLRVGDVVLLNGKVHTGRDSLHHHLLTHEAPVPLKDGVIYHCGPVVLKEGNGWKMTAAGPTTSIREEPYQADILRKFGVRAVIGKGGMGAKTLAALQEVGAVYLNAIGGAAQFYAECVSNVDGVDFLEFGIPEAMWHIHIKDFPAIVTMDAHGKSLHAEVEASSAINLESLKEPAVR